MNEFKKLIHKAWYEKTGLWWLSWPLTLVFLALSQLVRWRALRNAQAVNAPVIVVGNIHVGGLGKSPIIQALARGLVQQGLRVGVLARGYGGERVSSSSWVNGDSDPLEVGDEPVMHAQMFEQLPQPRPLVLVDPNRCRGAEKLAHLVDVILCDDGLQHYRLKRDCEICVYEHLGNGQLLPTGPLREPLRRLKTVDFILSRWPQTTVLTGLDARWFQYEVQMGWPVPLFDEDQPLGRGVEVCAVAGIAQPGLFFKGLEHLGLRVEPKAYADHHQFTALDLEEVMKASKPIVMTLKDSVKLRPLLDGEGIRSGFYVVPYEAILAPALIHEIYTKARASFDQRSSCSEN